MIPEEIRKVNPDMPDAELGTYIDKVWQLLESMVPGNVIIISEVARKYPELFIECAKWYMREHNDTYQEGLSFADGYEQLRKYDLAFINKKSKTDVK